MRDGRRWLHRGRLFALAAALALALAAVSAASATTVPGLGPIGNFVVDSPNPFNGYFGTAVAIGDFDGDGIGDLAVGAPGDDENGSFSGRVSVFLGDGVKLVYAGSYYGTAESATGSALAVGDFDGNGVDEIAVGAPNETVAGHGFAGRVIILGWSGTSLAVVGSFQQGMVLLGEAPEDGDSFGYSLAVGDFNHDTYDDLAIGAPYETLTGVAGTEHGLVHVLYGFASGLTTFGAQQWTQSSSSVLGAAEDDDWFGFALAAGDFDGNASDDLAIGIPGEEAFVAPHAGGVAVLYGASSTGLAAAANQLWLQGVAGLAGAAATDDDFGWSLCAGDFNGDGQDDLAIGSPGDDPFAVESAGTVITMDGSPQRLIASGSRQWRSNDLGVVGAQGDQLGASLACGSFDGDSRAELAIAMPFSDVDVLDGGEVFVIRGTQSGLTATGVERFSSGGLASAPAAVSQHFGSALAVGDLDGNGQPDLAVGVPFRPSSATALTVVGLVQVIRANSQVLFFDGFESHDLTRWSLVAP